MEAFSCFNCGTFGGSVPGKRQIFSSALKALRSTLDAYTTSCSTYTEKSSRRGGGGGGDGGRGDGDGRGRGDGSEKETRSNCSILSILLICITLIIKSIFNNLTLVWFAVNMATLPSVVDT